MGIANKYNRGSKFTYKAPDSHKFESLVDLFNANGEDNVYTIKGFWINKKSKYGKHPVIVTPECYIGLPKHLTDVFEEMMKDDDAIKAINNNELGFTIYPYTKGKDEDVQVYYSITLIDC